MTTENGSRQPRRRTIGQLVDEKQSNNDIMPLVGGNKIFRRVQATQDKLLADPYAALKNVESRYKFKPKDGDQYVRPETCLYWLSLNTQNRAVTDARVLELREYMIDDEWHNTYQPIVFYTEDNGKSYVLVNGQTRLWAGWLSGCTVEHTIRITDDPKVLEHLDDHKARTVGDLLSTHKYPNYHMLASATGMVRGYIEFNMPFDGAVSLHNAPKFRRGEILEFCQHNATYVQMINDAHRALPWTKRMMRSPSLACAMYYLTSEATANAPSREFHAQFWQDMETGVGLDATHPVLRLRHILTQNMTAPKRYDTLTIAALVAKTWNLCRTGRVRGRIGWAPKTERFPAII